MSTAATTGELERPQEDSLALVVSVENSAPLRGGEGGVGPVVSPDGAWVGFVDAQTQRQLLKVLIFGGSPVALTEVTASILGVTWGADDQIIFSTVSGGVFRVSSGRCLPSPRHQARP